MKTWLKVTVAAVAVIVVAGGGVIWWMTRPDVAQVAELDTTGRAPKMSETRTQTIPTINVAKATGWPNGGKPTAAAGLQVAAFADKLNHPRSLYRLANGDVLVAEANSPPRDGGGITGWVMGMMMKKAGAGVPSANRITLLRDTNGDGIADQRSVLLDAAAGLNSPTGMVVVGEWLYVANTDAVVRYPFKPGETKITAKPEKIFALAGGGNHWARNLVASADGKSLYVAVGSSSNIAENGLAAEGAALYGSNGQPSQMAKLGGATNGARAAILQIDPATKTGIVYAWGLRNANAMAFEPKSGQLWTVVNERDMLGSDMPPDYLTQVDMGAFYGWPWNYWGGYVDSRVTPGRPELRQYTRRPDFGLGAHTAPLGLAFASDAKLGGNYANGAFISLHGSWNREPVTGYKLVYVPFGDHGFPAANAKPVDLLTGFLGKDGKTSMGRPVGVITDASGALLVADDVGNTIWRVSAAK